MEKLKMLKVEEQYDYDYLGTRFNQRLIDKDTNIVIYRVKDLSNCPEDAIIGRDLCSAEEYIEGIQYGMELAKQGYTKLDIEYCSIGEKDE